MGSDFSFVVRVLGSGAGGEVAFLGTGMVVVPDRVLTCKHVILEADPLGRPTDGHRRPS